MSRSLTIWLCPMLATACAAPVSPPLRSLAANANAADLATSPAQEKQEKKPSVVPDLALAVGFGFSRDPDTNVLGASLDLDLGEHFSWGPAAQLGVDDDRTLFAPFVNIKRHFPIKSESEFASKLLPYSMVGAGLAYLEQDRAGAPSADESGFLLVFGGGIRYSISDRVGLGSHLQFNYVPDEILNERSWTSWEVLQLVLTF